MLQGHADGAPSPRATRIGLLVVVPVALLLGARAVSWAVPKVWSSGETLTAEDLNRNFRALEEAAAQRSWTECGTLESLHKGASQCVIDGFSPDDYEYGFKYNSPEAYVLDCLRWNVGTRVVNRHPYLVNSDDPSSSATQLGGALFYTDTNATDDDIPAQCPSGMWRQRYWRIAGGSVAMDLSSNGCVNIPIYCRRR